MEAIPAKSKDKQNAKHGLNLELLEQKVVHLIEMIKILQGDNALLKQKNKDLHVQLKALEGSLVAETKDLEELSQEKMMTKMVVDNLLHSIDALIEIKREVMSAEIKKYKARIFGELYVIVSDQDEAMVAEVVHTVDSMMKELAAKPTAIAIDAKKIAVLTALRVTQELLALQQQLQQEQKHVDKIVSLLNKEEMSLF